MPSKVRALDAAKLVPRAIELGDQFLVGYEHIAMLSHPTLHLLLEVLDFFLQYRNLLVFLIYMKISGAASSNDGYLAMCLPVGAFALQPDAVRLASTFLPALPFMT